MNIELISLILNALLGSGLVVSFLKLKTDRQKARTEVNEGNVDLVTKSVTSMIESQQRLMQHNDDLIKALTASRRENNELSEKLDELEKKINTMLKANRLIVSLLKKLKVDENYIKMLEGNE